MEYITATSMVDKIDLNTDITLSNTLILTKYFAKQTNVIYKSDHLVWLVKMERSYYWLFVIKIFPYLK